MFDILLTALSSIDSPEIITTICGAIVTLLTAIIALIKKKVKPGSKMERAMSLAYKYGKEFFILGKKAGEEKCKSKTNKTPHKAGEHPRKDGKKT